MSSNPRRAPIPSAGLHATSSGECGASSTFTTATPTTAPTATAPAPPPPGTSCTSCAPTPGAWATTATSGWEVIESRSRRAPKARGCSGLAHKPTEDSAIHEASHLLTPRQGRLLPARIRYAIRRATVRSRDVLSSLTYSRIGKSQRGPLVDPSVRTPTQSVLATPWPRSLWSAPCPGLLFGPISESNIPGSTSVALRWGNRHPRASARSIHSRISPPDDAVTRDPVRPADHAGAAGSGTRAGALWNGPPTPVSCHGSGSVTCTRNDPRGSGCPFSPSGDQGRLCFLAHQLVELVLGHGV